MPWQGANWQACGYVTVFAPDKLVSCAAALDVLTHIQIPALTESIAGCYIPEPGAHTATV